MFFSHYLLLLLWLLITGPEGPRKSESVTPPWSSFSLKHFFLSNRGGAGTKEKHFQVCWFVRMPKRLCRRLRIAILVPTVKESTAGSQHWSVNKFFIGADDEGALCQNVRVPVGVFPAHRARGRWRRKVFPGLLVCQNSEAALQTAPDRDSGSDRQRIHRGESVNKFLWMFFRTAPKGPESPKPSRRLGALFLSSIFSSPIVVGPVRRKSISRFVGLSL